MRHRFPVDERPCHSPGARVIARAHATGERACRQPVAEIVGPSVLILGR